MHDCLGKVGTSSQGKEDGEEVGGAYVGAELGPLGVWVRFGCALRHGVCGDWSNGREEGPNNGEGWR